MDSNFLTILILVVFLIIIPIQIKGIYEYYKDKENVKNDKILAEFSKVLEYLENSNIKYMCGNIALEVIKNGCYYGYIVDTADGMTLQ